MNFVIPFGEGGPPRDVDRVLECEEWLPEALRVFGAHGVANAEPPPRRRDEPRDDRQHATALQRRQKAAAVNRGLPVIHEMNDERYGEALLDALDQLHHADAAEDGVDHLGPKFADPGFKLRRQAAVLRQTIAEYDCLDAAQDG